MQPAEMTTATARPAKPPVKPPPSCSTYPIRNGEEAPTIWVTKARTPWVLPILCSVTTLWISISAQNELIEREVSVERRSIAGNISAETAELTAMYEADGMSPPVAAAAAADVMANPARALAVHTREEMGVDPRSLPSALKAAVISFACFLVGAVLPLLPWLSGASGAAPAFTSLALGVIAAAFVGAAIGRLAERSIVASVLRQVVIVLVACAVTYAIGELFDVNMS